jgi:SulP family sulfate permease
MIMFKLPTKTVGDVAPVGGVLPSFHVPQVPITLQTLWIVLPYSIILALIGLMETLLTQTLVDDVTQTPSKPNLECFGQGLANVITGMFGGMGGCAMIGQTMINLSSNGRSRLSGVVCALAMLCYILFASRFIEMIPLASLVGIMFVVCAMTFKWSSVINLHRVPWIDALLVIVVSISTIMFNLAIAVIIGMVLYFLHKVAVKKGYA